MDNYLNKKLLIFTGKGGIGKSLVAAAFGQYAANKGFNTLLVERSEQEQLAPLFGTPNVRHRETYVSKNLSCINLNAAICLEEYIVKQLGQKKLFEKVFSNNMVRTFFDTIPGLAEAMILGRIFHSSELEIPKKYDLVIFDAPASGHLYNLMTTPDAIINSGIGGPLVKEITRVKTFLSDQSKCAGIVVTVPESLISSETLEFLPKLQKESPVLFDSVFINKSVKKIETEEQKLLEHCDSLRHAAEFVTHRNDRTIKIQEDLIASLQTLPQPIRNIKLLPYLAVIKEPLDANFGNLFLGI